MQVGEKRNTLPNAEYGITYLNFWTTYLTTGPIWVVLQKLPQLNDTHFYQVLNKLEKRPL